MLLELLWFAYSYARSGMTEKTFLVPELEAGHSGESVSETEGEIYGIGIEKGAGNFQLHRHSEGICPPPHGAE